MVVLFYAVSSTFLMRGYLDLEQRDALANAERVVNAIQNEAQLVSDTAADWGEWSEMLEYVQGTNAGFYDENLDAETVANLNIHVAILLDLEGEIVAGHRYDFQTMEAQPVPPSLQRLVASKPPLLEQRDALGSTSGLIMTDEGLMIFAANPILEDANTPPSGGTLFFGRYLNDDEITRIGKLTALGFSLEPHTAALSSESNTSLPIKIVDSHTLHSHFVLHDYNNQPVMTGHVTLERSIYQKGLASLNVYVACLAVFGFIFAGVIALALQRGILRRVETMQQRVNKITQSNNHATRLPVNGNDELDRLAGDINHMLDVLDSAQQELISASHKAGMAEIATDVIHNIGNVLNSVNTAAGLTLDRVSHSSVRDLHDAAKLVESHSEDLEDFVARDERGKLLPRFLTQLSETLAREQASTVLEISQLVNHVDHIKNIVATQQGMAKTVPVVERVDLRQVIDEALSLDIESCKNHGINLVRDFENVDDLPPITLDRHKVVQVLINLIANAKQAVKNYDGEKDDHQIIINLTQTDDQTLEITVTDTGCGIAPENIDAIFRHGFTTHAAGHGFGLHSAANATQQMGGQLTAHSAGHNCGAAFTLALPIEAHETTRA